MAFSTQTDAAGQLNQPKTVSGTFFAISSSTQTTSISFKCSSCCRLNQHLVGWFGGYPSIKGLCPEALPEWAPLDFYNNGIPVYGTFNFTATGAYTLAELCLPETWTVYFKNPWDFPGYGQSLKPDGFVNFTPQSHYCYAGYYTPGETAPDFEMKTWTPNFYWPYEDKGDYFFNLKSDGRASMQFRSCSCLPEPNGSEFWPPIMFKTGTFGNGYISDSFVLPDEYSCNPFSIKYSGVFYYQDYFTYQYVQLGEFTITFTF